MTVTFTKAAEQAPRLYPDGMGGYPPCERCFQRADDLAVTADRRISPEGALTQTCGACFHALAAGQTVALPTGEALTQTWKNLARWEINEEIERPLVDRAFAALAPGLTAEDAATWFGELSDALLWQQEIEQPGYDMQHHEPEMRDIDLLRTVAESRVTEALQALTGGAKENGQ